MARRGAENHKESGLNHTMTGSGRVGLLLLAGVLGACGSSQDDSDKDACVPGRSVECVGPNACHGVQICAQSGDEYGPCVCSTSSTAGTTNLGASGSGASSSLPTGGRAPGATDSGGGTQAEGSGGTPASTTSGGSSAGAGSAAAAGSTSTGGSGQIPDECDPVSMSDWTPPAYVPARSPQSVCTDEQIQQFVDDCLLGQDCSAFEAGGASADCGQCLWPSPLDGSDVGPVIELSPRPFYRWDTNVAGCVELAGEAECAAKIQAVQVCAQQACLTSCGVSSPGYSDCVDAARTGTCATYNDAAVCIMNQETATRCSGTGFSAIVLSLGRVFCGS